MKFISNILMLAVLVFNNLSVLPFAFPTRQATLAGPTATPTAALSSEPTPAPAPTETTLPPTETPASIETVLPPTETALPPTITSTPTESAQPANTPTILLTANPDFISPGQDGIVEWTIQGVALEKQGLQLEITLSPALEPQDPKDPAYDSVKRMYSFPLESLSGSIKLRALDGFKSAELHAVLLSGNETIAKATLTLPYLEKFNLDAKGGEVGTRDGRIKLNFPGDVFKGSAEIWIGEPAGDALPTYSLSGAPFEIKAYSAENRSILSAFDAGIEIDVAYDETQYVGNERFLTLNWYDPKTGEWLGLPSMVDTENNIIHGITTHFTVFDIDVNNWQASRLPTVDSFQVANFTGAATYSMPIEVPAGPGGLQPALSLSYNSQVVDSATTQSQASWVGMGWSLDSGYIETNSHGTSDWAGDDTFMLSVNGVSSGMVRQPRRWSPQWERSRHPTLFRHLSCMMAMENG